MPGMGTLEALAHRDGPVSPTRDGIIPRPGSCNVLQLSQRVPDQTQPQSSSSCFPLCMAPAALGADLCLLRSSTPCIHPSTHPLLSHPPHRASIGVPTQPQRPWPAQPQDLTHNPIASGVPSPGTTHPHHPAGCPAPGRPPLPVVCKTNNSSGAPNLIPAPWGLSSPGIPTLVI